MKVEYPKWLYRGSEAVLVADAKEHEQYADWNESQVSTEEKPSEPVKRKPGRPRKEQ